jgi:hypothetical protein
LPALPPAPGKVKAEALLTLDEHSLNVGGLRVGTKIADFLP